MKLSEFVLGKPKSPLDPKVFERLALAAFLAWVGLGSDGLSSSCYGPEEIFESLGPHRAALAPFLILAVILTVSVLSAGYANTIEAFPGGGGGYLVATKSLGRYPGLVCGCALVFDYVLTIAISMASGMDALFSAVPGAPLEWKLPATVAATLLLMTLNLRGVKESILVLMPVFLGFVLTHTFAILAALISHGSGVGTAIADSVSTARQVSSQVGTWGLVIILFKAYTVGAGTYTGIEAVSNSVPILREPRVATAKRTMLFMAISLSFMCGGLLMGYLLYDVRPVPGKTLNAVFLERLTAGSWVGTWFVPLTLITEGALLFVAAQAGYVDGPRVMASMATDFWFPRWFRRLSDRLIVSNGVLLIGSSAIAAVVFTGGRVKDLVILYAFTVFITFVLSQLGMIVHLTHERDPGWKRRVVVNGLAFLLSAAVVVGMAAIRFRWVWVALFVLLLMVALCLLVRSHYQKVGRLLKRLDHLPGKVEREPSSGGPAEKDPEAPTAVVLVRGYNGAGIHSLLTVLRLFPNYFRNFIFASVGDIDFDRFKGEKEVKRVLEFVEEDLNKYVALVRKWGYYAERRYSMGVDVVDEATKLCLLIAREFPRALFFAGHLVYEQPTLITRILHEQTGEEIQRRLQFEGHTVIMLPIRVMESQMPSPP